jgi:hypothetical protein
MLNIMLLLVFFYYFFILDMQLTLKSAATRLYDQPFSNFEIALFFSLSFKCRGILWLSGYFHVGT